METVTTLPRGQAYTRDDLDKMPDDGHRYELIDGSLVVTPAPSTRHQGMAGQVYLLLTKGCPDHLRVLFAPLDVTLAKDTVVQPDLLVAPRSAFNDQGLPEAPLLAVEILSPHTRHIDLGLKRSRYEAAGCASYWVIDPDQPSLTVWELQDDAYVEVAHVTGEEQITLTSPYPLTITPAELVD